MRMNILNHLVCPKCQGKFLFSIQKKIEERVIDGELKCKKCGRKFYIKNSIVCFTPPNVLVKKAIKDRQAHKIGRLKKAILNQLWPAEWKQLFSKQEFFALQKEMKWMLSVIKKDKNAIHLDFATGLGMFLRKVVFQTKGELVALDNGYETCQELQYFLKKIKKYNRVSIVCADARAMPFRKGIFDSITSWHGLDEPSMERAVKETRRVLKKGGYFAASGIHYQEKSKSFSRAKKHNINFLTKEEAMRILKKIGFHKIEHRIFYEGRWNEEGNYLPIFGDLYITYAVRAKR